MLKKLMSVIAIGFAFAVLAFTTTASAEETKLYGYSIPIDIDINGNYIENPGKGILCDDGLVYVPLRYVSNVFGANVVWEESLADAVVTAPDKVLVFDPSSQGCYVNDCWIPAAQMMKDGVLYVDSKFIFTWLGGCVLWDDYRYEVKVTVPGFTLPNEYIEKFYTPNDLYWLSKIVTCEAGSVSFEAQVMVSNVILNRRASSSFPNTVYDVIYDRRYGIQFSPAYSGKLSRANPSTKTVLACKAALNGLDLAPGCLYFIYASNKNGWIARTRPLYKVLGNQAFYK